MSELKKLCLEDNNPVLIHDLHQAIIEEMVSLQHRLWEDIEKALEAKIPDLPNKDAGESDTSRDMIEGFVTRKKGYGVVGLYYPFGGNGASLGVEVETDDSSLFFGIRCHKKDYPYEHGRLKDELKGMGGGEAMSGGLGISMPTEICV